MNRSKFIGKITAKAQQQLVLFTQVMHHVGYVSLRLLERNVTQAVVDGRNAFLKVRRVAAVRAAGRVGSVQRVMRLLLLASVICRRRGIIVDG